MKDSSAYMIRLELLKLAQSIELERTLTERIRLEHDWNAKANLATINNELPPPFPDTEIIDHQKVINVAKSLNDFVSKGE